MKKKNILIFCVLFLLILSFFISKVIWFNINEDAYFTMGRTYDGEVKYLMYNTEKRDINNVQSLFDNYSTESYSKIRLKIPYNPNLDSITSKKIKGAVLSEIVSNEISKSFIINLENDELSKELKKELFDIDNKIDTTDIFGLYKIIYDYYPDKNLIINGYESIKKDIRLSSLKAINYVSGSEKKIYEFTNKTFKGFQFCIPNECKRISVKLFDRKNNEWTLLFKNFTQNEIDFILSSMELVDE